jgi:hypothetical protein
LNASTAFGAIFLDRSHCNSVRQLSDLTKLRLLCISGFVEVAWLGALPSTPLHPKLLESALTELGPEYPNIADSGSLVALEKSRYLMN